MRSVLSNKNVALRTRYEALRTYILRIVLYNSENWTVTKQLESRIKAFEMWCFRRMRRLSWQKKMSNGKVVQLMEQQPILLRDMRIRDCDY